MGPLTGTSEIIETSKDLNDVHSSKRLNPLSSNSRVAEIVGKHLLPILARDCSAENNLNQLVEAIDLRNSSRGAGPSNQPGAISIRKNTMKKPIRVGISQASGIGVSEPVSLKQALRGLCISQASEMATQKRLSKPAGLSGVSEAGTIKRLYRTVVVQAGESGHPLEEGNGGGISILPNSGTSSTCGLSNPVNGNFVEISLVPESGTSDSSEQISESLQSAKVDLLKQNAISPWPRAVRTTPKTVKTKNLFQDELVSVSREAGSKSPKPSPRMKVNSDSAPSTPGFISRSPRTSCKGIISDAGSRANRMVCKNKNCARRKGKQVSPSVSSSSSMRGDVGSGDLGRSTNKLSCSTASLTPKNISKESQSPASRSCNVEASSSYTNTDKTKSNCSLNTCDQDRTIVKTCESSRSREKGECSQSSKSSIGEYSSSSAISDESNLSGSSCNGNRPHMSMDSRWEAIRQVEMQHGSLGLRHFKFLKRLGCGDIGTVYLAELTGSKCQFALKVMDNEFLASRKKMLRAQTEKDILQMLDHPFLPTLYTHFTTDRLSCLVMEYCPGGDLHVLRQRQPGKSFSEQAARFYAAEILLALEYLHMLGVVYRDLKPENVLVREDGHIMLSDFDLSLRCTVNPTLLKSSSSGNENERKVSGICAESSCINPPCIQPWVQMPCFTPRHISPKTRKLKPDIATQVSPLPQLVVEPIDARSNSFVGTHEYLAPEIIKGEGHGSAVDWWTFGIFLYELLFGKTPFKGSENQDTLANVVSQCLKFPENPAVGYAARDLIKGLLIKEPGNRVGLLRGAAEIKQHPFFEGLNWALVRCASPPEMPKVTGEVAVPATTYRKTRVSVWSSGQLQRRWSLSCFSN